MNRSASVAALSLLALAGAAPGQVQHGSVDVVEINSGNTSGSISLSRTGGDGVWTTISAEGSDSSSRGDYFVDFFTGNDAASGILVSFCNQLGRAEPSVPFAPYYASAATDRSASGRYWLVVTNCPDGGEVNFNVCHAFFPIADGWLGAMAYNSANNGPLTTLVGDPSIQLRDQTTFTGAGNELVDDTTTNGFYLFSSQGTDFRRDGVILTSGAKNEDNRSDLFLNYDGRAVVHCIDNGSESGGENDGVGFVFIPDSTAGVTMGAVTATARTLYRQGDFTVEMVGQPVINGTFKIRIAGESPDTGTLVAMPGSELSGTSIDNVLFIQRDADGWTLETRDIEPISGGGPTLQDLSAGDIAFHFAFFKNGANITPGTPSRSYAARLNSMVSARFQVTEVTPDNGNGDCRADRVLGSDALDIFGDNRGDYNVSWLGARPAAYTDNALDALEGVFMASSSEFLRDNSGTGGISGWTTASFDNSTVALHNASPAGGEINANFALAFFPASLGLQQDADVAAVGGVASVGVSGNAATDGVLLAMNWDNTNSVVAAVPNGSAYDLSFSDGSTGLPVIDSTEYGYVYLPYSRSGLVAGQIDAAGAVTSGTGNFTAGSGIDATFGFPVTTITIPGVDARTDGALMLTATTPGVSFAWEAGPNGEFEVAGLDLVTGIPGQGAFMFAFIPAETAGEACPQITRQPADAVTCPFLGAGVTANASGASLAFQWQKEDVDNPGTFIDVVNGPTGTGGTISGAGSTTLSIDPDTNGRLVKADGGVYRLLAFNSCGTVESDTATITVCIADFNCDGQSDFFDYLDFAQAFNDESSSADVNGDSQIDFFDYLDFVQAFDQGC